MDNIITELNYRDYMTDGERTAPFKLSKHIQDILYRSNEIDLHEIFPSFKGENISFHILFRKKGHESREVILTFHQPEQKQTTATIGRTDVSIRITDQDSLNALIDAINSTISENNIPEKELSNPPRPLLD